MTKVLFCYPKDGNDQLYFDCLGHSDYRSSLGWNDCCVATSNLAIMLTNYVNDRYGVEPVICEEGHIRLEIDSPDELAIEVFRAAEKQFLWLTEEYKGYIKVY